MRTKSLLLVIFSFFLLFLSACGGSTNVTTPTPTVNGNGIEVPPEPNPELNNSTLKGVDSNNNDLRDDVEILVAAFSKKNTYENYTLKIAQLIEKTATEDIKTQEEYNSILSTIVCLDKKRLDIEKQILSMDTINIAIVNTEKRKSQENLNAAKWNNGSVLEGVEQCQ